MKRQLLPNYSAQESDARLEELFRPYFQTTRACAPLDRMMYLDTKVWLPDDLLLKADKMTMANALELRVPFLDHKLVEYAATLPEHLKISGGVGKVILRKAMRGLLPSDILGRPKKGFPVPTRAWFKTPLAGFAREVLLDPRSACRSHFDPKTIDPLLTEHTRRDPH